MRGWQRERPVPVRAVAGDPLGFVAGIARDVYDVWVGVMAIGDDGSAVLTQDVVDRVARNMTDAILGDREPRAVPTVDTTGRPISISTGRADSTRGPAPVLRIGSGPTVVLTDKVQRLVEVSMQAVVVDARRLNEGGA